MSEIKACPFCGGNNIYVDGYEHDAGVRWRVVCLDCMGMVDPGTIQQKYRAIEAWNSRSEGWISVSERLPKKEDAAQGVWVLVVWGETNEVSPLLMPDIEDVVKRGAITRWMPLPEPPEGVDRG